MPVPGFNALVTAAGGGRQLGSRCYHYSLRTNGVFNAELVFKTDDTSGEIIWKDTCIAEDLSKPYPATKKPIGFRQNQKLWVEVTGIGAEVYLSYE